MEEVEEVSEGVGCPWWDRDVRILGVEVIDQLICSAKVKACVPNLNLGNIVPVEHVESEGVGIVVEDWVIGSLVVGEASKVHARQLRDRGWKASNRIEGPVD